MIFEHPLVLFLAAPAALFVAGGVWLGRRKRERLARAWSPDLARLTRRTGRLAPLVLGTLVLLLAAALAGPRGGVARVTAQSRALSLVIAIDISRSMLAEDAAPNRLQRAVAAARRLVQDSPGDRIGLIGFAGGSYILSPLTVDRSAIRLFLDDMDPDLASEGGTDLAAPLTQGTQLLLASEAAGDRVLVLFTDGESHDSLRDDVAAARTLRRDKVRLVIVAEGGTAPVRIPIRDSTGTLVDYKRDDNAQLVHTWRRDDVIQAVAEAGNGAVIAAGAPDQAGAVHDLLASFRRNPTAETRASDLAPKAWVPLLAAAVLFLAYSFLRRGGALLSIAALALLAPRAQAQRPDPGFQALREGRAQDAASAFLREARGASARDTAYYNAGTAALRAGRLDVARGALTEAAKSLDPRLRYRALYNLGLTALLAAQADSSRRGELLDEAGDRLRQALLLEPGSERAKWNLELATRRRPPPPPPTAGGNGGGAGGGGSRPEPPPPQGGLSQAQADQILNSMERDEAATRANQQRTQQTGSGEKDW